MISDLTGFGPQTSRLTEFTNVLSNSLIQWNSSSILTDYANTYAYFRFLADVYGESILNKVFNSTKTGVAGVNEALSQLNDSEILSGCLDHHPIAPYFDCTFRYMWADLYAISGAEGAHGVLTNTSNFIMKPSKFTFQVNHKPSVPGGINIQTTDTSLRPYALNYFNNPSFNPRLNNGCSGVCSMSNFTLFREPAANPTHLLIYNHLTVLQTDDSLNITKVGITAKVASSSLSKISSYPKTSSVIINKTYNFKKTSNYFPKMNSIPIKTTASFEEKAICGHTPMSRGLMGKLKPAQEKFNKLKLEKYNSE